ncbi:GIN domain-containing protein [Aurantibacter aestuarii]|uniref:Putative auto-transporter adhesin head GIN domain-containing protein n=1 Tax=Aurantibacter aestuarii TaxID=1266046 RepID=A0A2T1N574_9FLAO|nr:DUF2807 domain-containing protein [Aurantibacter aestuarii]PSG86422.1 hypothetical protein C7H52_12085 [Aurantibacter aestuarii]
MKKIVFTLTMLLFVSMALNAQTKEKIKGSREVVKSYKVIDSFNRLVLGDDIEVRLLRSDEPAIEITADDNLIDVIAVTNYDGEMTIKTTMRIASYKTLKITVFYTDALEAIMLKNEAEVHSDITLKFNDLTVVTQNESKVFLTVTADKFKITHNDDSSAKLNVTAKQIALELNDNSKLEALTTGDTIEIDMLQRAEADIEGDTNNLELHVDNSCEFDGRRFTTKNAIVTANNRAKINIEVNETLKLSAEGTSEVSIYGNPKIELEKFADEAILYKKKL